MSMLEKTVIGGDVPDDERDGLRIAISGAEKSGKTTFTSQSPDCYFIPVEVGYTGIDKNIARQPMLTTYANLNKLIDEIIAVAREGQWPHKCIVIDSVSALEEFIHEDVLMADPKWGNTSKPKPKSVTMAATMGGYGEGYNAANSMFMDFLRKCDVLAVECKINIIFTAHVIPVLLMDPVHGSYSTFELALHSPKNAKTIGKRELFTRWLDVIGFLYEPIDVTTTEQGNSLARSLDGTRMLGLSRTPAYTAGCRLPLTGEIEIPLINGWNSFAGALHEVGGPNLWNYTLPE